MLLRAFITTEHPAFQKRVEQLLDVPDLLVTGILKERELQERLASETVDLIFAEEAALKPPLARTIASLRSHSDQPEIVVFVDKEDPQRRAELLAAGCAAVLYAGLPDDMLGPTVSALIARRRGERAGRRLHTPPTDQPTFADFVSSSRPMRELVSTAKRVARADTSLLMLGETGVGKERLARAIHAEGPRHRGPFVAVNCGAIPEALLESELFGHEKGAFTGAMRPRRGHFELAHRGTFFLDEVGDLPAHVQVKLLRVLQDHKIQPVGSERTLDIDVRVIAATSRDLVSSMKQKLFREDLYYRLGVVTLTLPPLRDRRDDIPGLADAYREHFATRLNRPVKSISGEALRVLVAYAWPGNVRELANVIERAVLLCFDDTIEATDLADLARNTQESNTQARSSGGGTTGRPFTREQMTWKQVREEGLLAMERTYLIGLLEAHEGRIGEVARHSGLNPRSLYEKMQKHDLRRERFRPRDASGTVEDDD